MADRRMNWAAGGLLLLLAACGHQPAPAPPPPAAPPASAPAPAAALAPSAEGSHIVLTPDSVHIEYSVFGSGDPAVLLVHGWAENSNYWQAQIEPLKAQHYTVVTLNLAGHGASTNNRSDWSIANYAQDVVTVARQLPQQHLVLVGHSMGAAVVLAATPQIGPRVIGIVAVEALRSVGQPPLAAAEVERRVAPFSADFIGATRKLVTEQLFEKGADPALVQKVAYDMSLVRPLVAVPSMRALLSMDLGAVLPQIHVPVYAINSDLLPTDAARIRRSLPDFTLDVLPHSSHFPMLEDPARFNPLLLKDVAAISQRAAH
jgi:pimeloyl-ACP methyl ester carboxylesterase